MVEFQSEWHITGVYSAVLVAVVLRAFSYVWLIYGISQTNVTVNIPYEMLAFDMVAALILLGVALKYGYFVHIGLYLTQFILVAYVAFQKYQIDG